MDRLPFRATPLASPYEGFSKLPVVILLDNVRSMYNVGSFFRTADAAAAEKILLHGDYAPVHLIKRDTKNRAGR